jgi:hypothetical protein
MSQLIPVPESAEYLSPTIVALDDTVPPLHELFRFMVEAELRFASLRMQVVERSLTALGEEVVTCDVTLRHPGRARIIRRRSQDALSREYEIWASDGVFVTSYDASNERASVRPLLQRPVGSTARDLPAFGRTYVPLTPLPPDDIVDTFIHPNGLIRNVLLTGPVGIVGTTLLAGGREAFVLRADHPRLTSVLTDRPDHWLELAVDRQTGMIVLYAEHVADQVTHHAEVVSLELDPPLPDEALTAHLPAEVRMLY